MVDGRGGTLMSASAGTVAGGRGRDAWIGAMSVSRATDPDGEGSTHLPRAVPPAPESDSGPIRSLARACGPTLTMVVTLHLRPDDCCLRGPRGSRRRAAVRNGCKRLTLVVRHQRFDSTKGYHGEGPDVSTVEEQAQQAMQRALDTAAIQAAAADAGRELHDPYCIRRQVGSKTRRYVMEQETEDDDMADSLLQLTGDHHKARGQLWAGNNMTAACPEGSMVGVVSFFNIDNIAYRYGKWQRKHGGGGARGAAHTDLGAGCC